MFRRAVTGALLLSLLPSVASAGVFFAMEFYARNVGSGSLSQGAVIHPVGYVGNAGELQVRVCVEAAAGSRPLVGPLQKALQIWNQLTPMTGNCDGLCQVAEEGTFTGGPTNAMSTLLHEVGHCGMALGHPNLTELRDRAPVSTANDPSQTANGVCDVAEDGCCGAVTSYTNSVNATHDSGSGIKGSFTNELVNNCPSGTPPSTPNCMNVPGGAICPNPAKCCAVPYPNPPIDVQDIFFFRRSDNNPVALPVGQVDSTTYSRATTNLPGSPPHYAANPNRLVAAALGFPDTQAVMYTMDSRSRVFKGLTADDVAMVKYANTGQDRLAGTADDYTPALRYQSSCTGAQLIVRLMDTTDGNNGECYANVNVSYTPQSPIVFHWSLIPRADLSMTTLELWLNTEPSNGDSAWDYKYVFFGDVEGGDLREWDAQSP